MCRNRWAVASVAMFLAFLVSWPVRAADAPEFKQENKPENLKALMEQVHQLAFTKKDAKGAAALAATLMPDNDRLAKGLKDNLGADVLKAIQDFHKNLPAMSETEVLKLAKPEQTVVRVHAATTEEIAKYEDNSVPFKHFPGGAKRVAEQVLRPKTTYYEVEFLEPGKESGIKYHLFFWDGKQWTMLGPLWRAIR